MNSMSRLSALMCAWACCESLVVFMLQLCYYVCLPACVCKNVINVAQLCSAANAVATQDAEAANKAK
jgi:hypothetical protein